MVVVDDKEVVVAVVVNPWVRYCIRDYFPVGKKHVRWIDGMMGIRRILMMHSWVFWGRDRQRDCEIWSWTVYGCPLLMFVDEFNLGWMWRIFQSIL